MKHSKLFLRSLAELFGTFFLVFVGCGSIRFLDLQTITFQHAPHLTFGLILVVCISLLAKISGAHFNPAVSFAFLLQKEINFKTFRYYVAFQVLGALLACYALQLFIPESFEFGATIPQIPTLSAFIMEMILTSILISVILLVALVFKTNPFTAGIVIGTTVALCSYFAGPLTGASMNPARTLAPNFFQGQGQITWLYILAPLLSAVLTSLFFQKFILKAKRQKL